MYSYVHVYTRIVVKAISGLRKLLASLTIFCFSFALLQGKLAPQVASETQGELYWSLGTIFNHWSGNESVCRESLTVFVYAQSKLSSLWE